MLKNIAIMLKGGTRMEEVKTSDLMNQIYQRYDEESIYFLKFRLEVLKIYLGLRKLYGKNSDCILELNLVYLEKKKKHMEYNKILRFILKNIDQIQSRVIEEVLSEMDVIVKSEKEYDKQLFKQTREKITVDFEKKKQGYSGTFNSYFKNERKDYVSFLDNLNLKQQLIWASLTFEDIKNYLDYPEEFFLEIKKRTSVIPYKEENSKLYGVNLECNHHRIIDYHLVIPAIDNLDTALITVSVLKEAYDIYSLKSSLSEEDAFLIRKNAQEIKEEFQKYCFAKLKKKI